MQVERAKGRGCLTRSVKLAQLVRYCSSRAEDVTIASSAAPSRAVRGGAHGQLPGGEGARGQGKLRTPKFFASKEGSRAGQQRKEGRQEVRGEEGETKEVTLATAFWFLLG